MQEVSNIICITQLRIAHGALDVWMLRMVATSEKLKLRGACREARSWLLIAISFWPSYSSSRETAFELLTHCGRLTHRRQLRAESLVWRRGSKPPRRTAKKDRSPLLERVNLVSCFLRPDLRLARRMQGVCFPIHMFSWMNVFTFLMMFRMYALCIWISCIGRE